MEPREPQIEEIGMQLEMALMSQEAVVTEFRDLARRDLGSAALHFQAFVGKLEVAASGGNAQVRSLIGGPDSLSRGGLIDILAGEQYSTASDEVKLQICRAALGSLLDDNYFYVRMAVAKIQNAYLIGDMIRLDPLVFPGADYLEADLLKRNILDDKAKITEYVSGNTFGALAVVLQRGEQGHAVDVAIIDNEEHLHGAAHVIAARHDAAARKKSAVSDTPKAELLIRYRQEYHPLFARMIEAELQTANWIALPVEAVQAK